MAGLARKMIESNRRRTHVVLWIFGLLCASCGLLSSPGSASRSTLPSLVNVARGAEETPPKLENANPAGAAESVAQTGTVEGEVIFEGQAPVPEFLVQPGEALRFGPVLPNGLKDESLLIDTKGKTQGIANVVIYLQKAPPGYVQVVPIVPAAFSQNGFRFHPHVFAAQTGQPLEFTNLDTVAANIHSYDNPRNASFNQVVPPVGAKAVPIKLPALRRPERTPIRVVSDLHARMNSAYILLLDHPFAGITDEFGKFKISNLPVGTYDFVVWHEKSGYLNRKLTVDVVAGKSPPLKLKFPGSKFGVGITDVKPAAVQDPAPAAPIGAAAKTGRLEGQITVDGEIPAPNFFVAPGAKVQGVIVPFGVLNEQLLVDPKSKGVANVVIYLQRPPAGYQSKTPEAKASLRQNGFQFVPHVLLIQAGQQIELVNQDPVNVNIHFSPVRNRPQDFALPPAGAKGQNALIGLEKPERLPVVVLSNLHSFMRSYVLVQNHPFCAVTDETGRFSIPNLPPGTHQFVIWHEKVGYLTRDQPVTITAGKTEKWSLKYPAGLFESAPR